MVITLKINNFSPMRSAMSTTVITSFLELCFNLKVGENILSPHMPIEATYHVTHIPENQSNEQDVPHTVFPGVTS